MLERLDRCWRIFATGLCFVCFGIGGVVLGVLVFPVIALFLTGTGLKSGPRIAKWVISRSFRALVELMRLLGLLSYELHGRERLRGEGLLILGNHPTLIDVVLLMGFVERADCIVKGALARNPFTRGPVRAAGFVFNDSGTGLVQNCVDSLRAGNNLIVFPEGTRTPRCGRMQLQRGAARIALTGGQDITPVRIRCTPLAMGKGERWYRVPRTRAHFHIEVCEPIRIAPFADTGASEALAARQLTDYLTDFFTVENRCATHHA